MAEIFDLILFEGRSVKYAKLRVTENPYSDIDLTQWVSFTNWRDWISVENNTD